MPISLEVRWWDAYREAFQNLKEARIGCDMLWMRHGPTTEDPDGEQELIPLRGVRRIKFPGSVKI
jgi:hypothetical protein